MNGTIGGLKGNPEIEAKTNENKLSQKVKPIHTVQDFAVCTGVAEIRK